MHQKFASLNYFPYICDIKIILTKYMMGTGKETTAEIASDVRKANRERTEAEYAEEKALKCELEKEKRALQRIQKEKMADFYFKVAILLLTGSVISCLTIFIKDANALINWQPAILGFIASIFFAYMAYKTLNMN